MLLLPFREITAYLLRRGRGTKFQFCSFVSPLYRKDASRRQSYDRWTLFLR
jgi:hypothetical protein